MIATPGGLIDQPAIAATERLPDVLADMLARVRLTGSLFILGDYNAPWALDVPGAADMAGMLALGARRLILIHIVEEGRFTIRANGVTAQIEAGDIVVLPAGDDHVMGAPELAGAVPAADLVPPPPWQSLPVVRIDGGGGERTRVVCGYLCCEEPLFNTFLKQLPPVFSVRPPPGTPSEWMRA